MDATTIGRARGQITALSSPVFGLLAVPLAGLYVAAALAQEVRPRATQPYRFHRSRKRHHLTAVQAWRWIGKMVHRSGLPDPRPLDCAEEHTLMAIAALYASWRNQMFSLLAIHYHTARLVFEAQNAMTFRLLRLVSDAGKLVPDEAPTNLVTSLPDEPLAPLKAAPREVKRRASTSKLHKKTVRVKKRAQNVNVTGRGLERD